MNEIGRIIVRVLFVLIGLATIVFVFYWGGVELREHKGLAWHTVGGAFLGIYIGAAFIEYRLASKPFSMISGFVLRLVTRTPPSDGQP